MYRPKFIKVHNKWQPIIRARHSKALDISSENVLRIKYQRPIPNFDPKKSYHHLYGNLIDDILPF